MPATTIILIYDQTFENCRFCLLGCGQDHPVFRGFVECDKHKANRLRYLQQQHELAQTQSPQTGQAGEGAKKDDRAAGGRKKELDWKDRVNAKLVKSCKVMDALNTECFPDEQF